MCADSPAPRNPASGITHPYCVEHDQPLEWCAHWIRDVFPEALSAGAEALAAEPGIGDTVAARLYAEKALRAAAPHLLAVGVSAHRAERDATLSRVRSLLDAAILISGERYVRAEYIREALEGDSDE